MSALQKDKESVPGRASYVTVAIFGAILIIASIYSLSRILNKSAVAAGDSLSSPGATDPTLTNHITPEEIERQHAMYQPQASENPVPVTVPSTVTPTNQNNPEVILQKAKVKVNQLIVERMKQYVKDNPTRDTREIEKQIKKRENQGAQIK